MVHQDSYLPLCHVQFYLRAGVTAESAAALGMVIV